MKAKKYWIVILLIVGFSVSVTGISIEEEAQIEIFGVSTLKGVSSIRPVVKVLKLGGEKSFDLSEDELQTQQDEFQTQVERALRKAGVNVTERNTPKEERLRFATLRVYVSVTEIELYEKYLYAKAIGVSVELHQNVSLLRDPKITTRTQTWPLYNPPEPMIVSGELKEVTVGAKEAVKRRIELYISRFLNDYFAANPKETAVEKKRIFPDSTEKPKDKQKTIE